MPEGRVELPCPEGHTVLSGACLPIPPPGPLVLLPNSPFYFRYEKPSGNKTYCIKFSLVLQLNQWLESSG